MWLITAALTGATGVVAGAFGAHALRSRLDPGALATWQTAVQYHLIHALALLALALFARATGRSVTLPSALLVAGVALFSGSLYLLATVALEVARAGHAARRPLPHRRLAVAAPARALTQKGSRPFVRSASRARTSARSAWLSRPGKPPQRKARRR